MDLVNVALDLLSRAGALGALVLFAWLWMSGRIISRGEMERAEQGHEREKAQLREELGHARREASEWKLIAVRGTELARDLGEKATARHS